MGNALRADWPARSLLSFLTKNFGARAYGDVAVALAWVCTRTKTDTPRLLLEAGPWWKAAATESAHINRPPRKGEECEIHAGQWRGSCAGCAADKFTGERTTPPNLRRPDAGSHIARMRAEIESARSNLCSHGVQPERCADHRAELRAARERQTTDEESAE